MDDDSRVLRRRVGDAETRRANRGWWDADADDYQAEHGAFLGDVDFVWCPEGLREADARLLGDVAGRRVLEVGCGAAAGARWLATQGARAGRLRPLRRHAAARRAGAAERTGVRVPLVQADALALPFADGVLRHRLHGVRRDPVRGRLGGADAPRCTGCCAPAAAGCSR